jgi:pimeloyl-ACP methyl ester carboxylesterase
LAVGYTTASFRPENSYESAVKLVLLPGFDGTGDLFAPLIECLPKDIACDIVSYREAKEIEGYVALVDAALPSRDAVLIAESFSGPIALELMARNPQRFRCAILCATFAQSPYRALTKLARWIPARLFARTALANRLLRHYCLSANPDPGLLGAAVNVLESVPAVTVKSRLQLLAKMDVRPRLANVTVPILYLQAAKDKLIGTRLSSELIASLPQVRVAVVDGPHLLLQSRPQECAALIGEFLTTS